MLRRKKNICGHWDCNKAIPDGDSLCAEHHQKWVDGFIDRCPKCGRFKDIMYYFCLDCYFGRPVKRQKPRTATPDPDQYPRVEYAEAWTDGYMRRDRRFVYVFEFDDGVFYVGHTDDMQTLVSKLRAEKETTLAGYNPRLQYLETAADEPAAESRVSELKKLIQTNISQMRMMALDFHNHLREMGLEEDS